MSDFLQPNGNILLHSQPEEPENPDPTTSFGVRRTDASTDPLADIGMFGAGTGNFQGVIALSTMNSGTSTGALVERMRIHTNGFVGIGTQTPTTTLEVAGRVKATAFQGDGSALTGVGDASRVSKAGDTMTGALHLPSNGLTVGSQLVVAAGNVGVGTNTPQAKLDVAGPVRANRYPGENALALNDYQTPNPSSNVYLYSPLNDRDAWIYLDSADPGSNWGIYHRQIDAPVKGLPPNSIGFVGGGQSKLQAFIGLQDGSAFFAGTVRANQFLNNSSAAYKERIDTLSVEQAHAVFSELRPVTFAYGADPTKELQAGFIAEEVPELVGSGDRTAIAPVNILAVLTKIVQHQQQTIERLERRIEAMLLGH